VSEKNGSICYVTTIWFVFPASRFPLTSPNCHIHLAHCPPIVSAMPTTSTAPTASAVPLDVLKVSISDNYIHTYYARPVRWQQDCAGRQISRKEVLQSTQFFILLPTPSNLSTHHTSRTNHTDPSECTPISNTTIDTSQSTHTHATRYLQPSNTSDPDHVACSYAPTFLHGILHRAYTSDRRSRYRKR